MNRLKKKILILIALVSLLLLLFISIKWEILSSIDLAANEFSESIQTPNLINIAKAIGFVFEPKYIIIFSLIISIILYIKKFKKESIFFALIMSIGGIFEFAYKEIIQRARPLNALVSESNYSFPSGHSTISMIFFGFLIYLSLKYIKSRANKAIITIISVFLILLIGFSRLYLNVHWFSDILGGFLLGAFILFSSIVANEIAESKS